ncbi:unnamed protein product [Dibothriocephalus latus]|uniref:Uncharacterized protein n=1 Tax=Dibothriocephalus latus TaxID=60516 RepID=A0A3P7MQB8_DIBLA|nr:unnamed protein product [Dibothriocephalus latus]
MFSLSDLNPLELFAEHLARQLNVDLYSVRYLLTIVFGTNILYINVVGYPIAIIYALFIRDRGARACNIYIFLTGFILSCWNFGYYLVNYGTYDINWTMAYCILCLRLIGFSWDYRDGALPEVCQTIILMSLLSAFDIFNCILLMNSPTMFIFPNGVAT